MTPHFLVDFYALTDSGKVRQTSPNQDTIFAQQDETGSSPWSLFIVTDGMGGHANGLEASQRATAALAAYVVPIVQAGECGPQALLDAMANGVQAANQAVLDLNEETGEVSGTTLTAALIAGATAYVVNVGDSRTYHYRAGELRQITTDHSHVQRLVEKGMMTRDEVYTHPLRNRVYRGLGDSSPLEVDQFTVALQEGDKVLLCSDGLWEMVRDPQIQALLASTSEPQVTAEHLLQTANANGGEDNVSAIVASILLPPSDGYDTSTQPMSPSQHEEAASHPSRPLFLPLAQSLLMPLVVSLVWCALFARSTVAAMVAPLTNYEVPPAGAPALPLPGLVPGNMGDMCLVHYYEPVSNGRHARAR